MPVNYLPNGDNATALFADCYFREDGKSRFNHMGIVDSATWTPEVTVAEKLWKNEVVATMTTAKSATLSVVLGEATWQNMKAMTMSREENLTQTAGSVSITATDVMPGELVQLGKYNVAGLEVLDDVGNTLIDGVDYTYNPNTDFIMALNAYDEMVITGTASIISDRKVLNLMSEDQGIKGEFKFIGTNQKGIKLGIFGIRAELRPEGDFTISSESGGEFQSFTVNGKVLKNFANNERPYGYAIEI